MKIVQDKSYKVEPSTGEPYWLMVSSKTNRVMIVSNEFFTRDLTPYYIVHKPTGRINEAIEFVDGELVADLLKRKPSIKELLVDELAYAPLNAEDHLRETYFNVINDPFFLGLYREDEFKPKCRLTITK